MAEAAMVEEQMEVPDGGIAELVMDDQTADEIYGADEEEVPDGGIAQFKDVAAQMAAMGREGDNMLAHLESGELVIPRKFLEENETFRNYVYAYFDGQGVDPERYIAGSDVNSLNPDTGLAEFFLKKIFRGVKKAVKGVVKVVKKVAPIVLPIVGTAVLGPVYGAAVGSGIGTLIAGGSGKDALKSALTAGAIGAVGAGVTGALTPGVGFGKGVSAALNPSNLTQGFGNLLSKPFDGSTYSAGKFGPAGKEITDNLISEAKILTSDAPTGISAGDAPASEKTFLDKTKDFFFPDPDELQRANYEKALAAREGADITLSEVAKEKLFTDSAPGIIQQYGPLAVAGTALAAGAGAFDTPEEEVGLIDQTTGVDLIADDPDKYLVSDLGNTTLNPDTGEYVVDTRPAARDPRDYVVPTNYAFPFRSPLVGSPGGPFARPSPSFFQGLGSLNPQMVAAKGGEVYPRRNGGIMPNEGIPDQDSVRALLMPGEFVMTKDAVRGLGNGNLNQGINNMYSVMSKLESRGRQGMA
jgi:hypothetical protein